MEETRTVFIGFRISLPKPGISCGVYAFVNALFFFVTSVVLFNFCRYTGFDLKQTGPSLFIVLQTIPIP